MPDHIQEHGEPTITVRRDAAQDITWSFTITRRVGPDCLFPQFETLARGAGYDGRGAAWCAADDALDAWRAAQLERAAA
ncbi:MAG: hypothetical protein AAGG47_21340 [Pseudomonadota bacterium]